MFECISLGKISQGQSSNQAPYAFGPSRQYPDFHPYHRRKMHDVRILDLITPEPGSFYIMDRAYLDFSRLYTMHQHLSFFVIRAKSNFNYRRLYSHPVDKTTGLQCDQTISVAGVRSLKDYPEKLRRIKYFDTEKGKMFVFLTNNFKLPATVIADLYRCRWRIYGSKRFMEQPTMR